jgi:acetyl-CoA carboxylase beta subunit
MTRTPTSTPFDDGSMTNFGEEFVAGDPISWPGYPEQLLRARAECSKRQAVTVGTAQVHGMACVFVHFDFAFAGGSLGQAEGQQIVAAFDFATERRLPLVSVLASGGARMQEGSAALVQMQRIAGSVAKARCAGIPHIAILQDPTTGGVWASLAAAADLIVAVPGARVSFAGSRTLPQGVDIAGAEFHSEGKLEHGFIDAIATHASLGELVHQALHLLSPATRGPDGSVAPLPHVTFVGINPAESDDSAHPGWDQVLRARSASRPRADAYIEAYFDSFLEIRGDRVGGVDPGVRCGFGRVAGRTVALIAQLGEPTRPPGFRTALRLLKLAERFGIPVLSLVDTPGALADDSAEAEGVGTAIAELLVAMSEAKVPVTSVIMGEGGSGGALAFLAPGSTWMTEDSFLAVTAPELAAAILKRGPDDIEAVADLLHLTPRDQVSLGVSRGVLCRGAQRHR